MQTRDSHLPDPQPPETLRRSAAKTPPLEGQCEPSHCKTQENRHPPAPGKGPWGIQDPPSSHKPPRCVGSLSMSILRAELARSLQHPPAIHAARRQGLPEQLLLLKSQP